MKSRRESGLRDVVWLLLAVVLLMPTVALAQTETGRISGTTMDQQGGVLPARRSPSPTRARARAATRRRMPAADTCSPTSSPVPTRSQPSWLASRRTAAPSSYRWARRWSSTSSWALSVRAETVQVVSETPTINTLNAEQATSVSEAQIRELPTITRNVYDLVGVAGNVSGGRVPTARSGRNDARHRLHHQRPRARPAPTSCSTAAQQQRVRYHGRPGGAARLRPGVQGHHQQLLGAVRPRDRRHRQRGDEVGHQQLPRHRLRVLSATRSWPNNTLRQQGERHREGTVHAESAGYSVGGPIVKRQGAFLHEPGIHPASAAPTP